MFDSLTPTELGFLWEAMVGGIKSLESLRDFMNRLVATSPESSREWWRVTATIVDLTNIAGELGHAIEVKVWANA